MATRHSRSNLRAFTLIEVLVVISLVGLLLALLMPAAQQAREAGRRASCGNNLRNLGLAMLNYHESFGAFPFGFDQHESLWSAMILPQVEQGPLYDTLIFEESGPGQWDADSANERAACTLIPILRCPSMRVPEHVDDRPVISMMIGRVPVSYRACSGSNGWSDDVETIPASAPPGSVALESLLLNGIFFGNSRIRAGDVRDGTSQTILLGESYTDPSYSKDGEAMDYWQLGAPQTGPWTPGSTSGTEFSEGIGSTGPRINSRLDPSVPGTATEVSFGSYHPGGAMFALADGSVRFLKQTMDPATYRALGSRAGGEIAAGD